MMRELTQEEIDNAPSWATDYELHDDGIIMYCNGGLFAFASGDDNGDIDIPLTDCNWDLGSQERKPIPRKAFDIFNCPFNDLQVTSASSNGINFCVDIESFRFVKGDAIAIAKHFKLTAEDIK